MQLQVLYKNRMVGEAHINHKMGCQIYYGHVRDDPTLEVEMRDLVS